MVEHTRCAACRNVASISRTFAPNPGRAFALHAFGIKVGKTEILKFDTAFAHLQVACALRVCHQRRLVKHARHFSRVAECLVQAREHGVDHVETGSQAVGVGKHHDQRAR